MKNYFYKRLIINLFTFNFLQKISKRVSHILHYIHYIHYIYFTLYFCSLYLFCKMLYYLRTKKKNCVKMKCIYIYNQLMKFSEEKIDRKDSKNPLIPKSSSISTIHHLYSASKVFDPEQSSPSLIADRN